MDKIRVIRYITTYPQDSGEVWLTLFSPSVNSNKLGLPLLPISTLQQVLYQIPTHCLFWSLDRNVPENNSTSKSSKPWLSNTALPSLTSTAPFIFPRRPNFLKKVWVPIFLILYLPFNPKLSTMRTFANIFV